VFNINRYRQSDPSASQIWSQLSFKARRVFRASLDTANTSAFVMRAKSSGVLPRSSPPSIRGERTRHHRLMSAACSAGVKRVRRWAALVSVERTARRPSGSMSASGQCPAPA